MLRNLVLGLLTFIFLITTTEKVFADEKIGVVDSLKVLSKSQFYSSYKKAETEVITLEKKMLEELKKKEQALLTASKTKNQKELEALKNKYKEELMVLQRKHDDLVKRKQQELEKAQERLKVSISGIIQRIAKQKGLTLVISKQTIFYGGIDITEEVLRQMK